MRQEKKNEELTSIDIGDDTSLQRRKSYIKNADEDLLQRPEKIQTRQDKYQRNKNTKLEEKHLYGNFKSQTNQKNFTRENWPLLRK